MFVIVNVSIYKRNFIQLAVVDHNTESIELLKHANPVNLNVRN